MALIPALIGFAEPGVKRSRLSARVQMGEIPDPGGPKHGSPFLPLFRVQLCHRGGSHSQAVPQHKGGDVPQMGQDHTADAEMAETGYGIPIPLFCPVKMVSTGSKPRPSIETGTLSPASIPWGSESLFPSI